MRLPQQWLVANCLLVQQNLTKTQKTKPLFPFDTLIIILLTFFTLKWKIEWVKKLSHASFRNKTVNSSTRLPIKLK